MGAEDRPRWCPQETRCVRCARCPACPPRGGPRTPRGGERMHRDKKAQVVAELTDEIRGATALLVTDPRGLNVGQLSELRRSLRTHGASFRVTKNTLGRIAAREAGTDALVDLLT